MCVAKSPSVVRSTLHNMWLKTVEFLFWIKYYIGNLNIIIYIQVPKIKIRDWKYNISYQILGKLNYNQIYHKLRNENLIIMYMQEKCNSKHHTWNDWLNTYYMQGKSCWKSSWHKQIKQFLLLLIKLNKRVRKFIKN